MVIGAALVEREYWCDPRCPYFQDQPEDVARLCILDPPARCSMLNCGLDFYDWWLAACTAEPTAKDTP